MKIKVFVLFSMLVLAGQLQALPPLPLFFHVYDFGGVSAIPGSGLTIGPDGNLYGITYGGAANDGTGSIYVLIPNADGTWRFKTIYRFSIGGSPSNDGQYPYAGMALSQDCTTLFGTTQNGGLNDAGVLYSLNIAQAQANPNGNPSGYSILHPFLGSTEGSFSQSALSIGSYGNYVYGTLSSGGPKNSGSVYVYDQTLQVQTTTPFSGGNGGANPLGSLTMNRMYSGGGYHAVPEKIQAGGVRPEVVTNLPLSSITFYGVTSGGGSNSCGTVYSVRADGSNFMVLHHFSFNSTDGSNPRGGMVLQSNVLYGTTSGGGANYAGTVFKINTDGSRFQIIGNFNSSTTGNSPQGDLIRWHNTLYGTTYGDSINNGGTVYSINTDGSNFQPLYSFSIPMANGNGGYTNSDGGWSVEGLARQGNILFGTTPYGGTNGVGTVYEIVLPAPPELQTAPANGNYQLSWPSYASGYVLQQSTNLNSTNWMTANYTITTNGLRAAITITPPKGNLFFRLINTNGP